jgi:Family of unknown function (DUF5670)
VEGIGSIGFRPSAIANLGTRRESVCALPNKGSGSGGRAPVGAGLQSGAVRADGVVVPLRRSWLAAMPVRRTCGAHSRHLATWRFIVLYTIAVVLLVLWLLGLVTSFTAGGLLHVLLVVAVVMVVFQLISGRRVG